MKIPFLNKRIRDEFKRFLDELLQSVERNVEEHRDKDRWELYRCVYPLFVLLRCLGDSTYVRDPARDIVLAELRREGHKEKFLQAVQHFNVRNPFQEYLSRGVQRQVFTGFFSELYSDALLLLNSFYTSNYRGCHIAVRCMLEDLYRHLYFRDHPQEFWFHQGSNKDGSDHRLRPVELRGYLSRTSYLSPLLTLNSELTTRVGDEKTLFDLNEELYSICSNAVHGAEDSTHNYFRSISDLNFHSKKASEVLRLCEQFISVAVPFIVSAHLDQFLSFGEYERSLVFSNYSPRQRASLRRVLNA